MTTRRHWDRCQTISNVYRQKSRDFLFSFRLIYFDSANDSVFGCWLKKDTLKTKSIYVHVIARHRIFFNYLYICILWYDIMQAYVLYVQCIYIKIWYTKFLCKKFLCADKHSMIVRLTEIIEHNILNTNNPLKNC